MSRLVTIKAFLTPSEGTMIQSFLDTEGIYSFLKDEHLVTTAPFFANISGGVKLQVREEDAGRALLLLKEAGYIREDKRSAREKLKENLVLILLLAVAVVIMLFLVNR
jgi:hypothetical protein